MKKWRCKVCGYIHEGEEPPDKCPVCGAPKEQFELLEEDSAVTDQADTGRKTKPGKKDARPDALETWQCQVCGYQHKGSGAPEKCLVCGAAQENFSKVDTAPEVDIAEKETPDSVDASAGRPDSMQAIGRTIRPVSQLVAKAELITRLHGHPIAVHIPNGLLPVSVIFTLVAVLFKFEPLAVAAKYNVGFVAISMPVVLITGFIDWFNRFGGHMTSIFKIKITCGIIVTALTLLLALWWSVDPQIYLGGKPSFYLFMLINLVNFATAAVAGFYGGKLVFKD